ncbi:MAG: acyltransferase [Bacteroidia bacterium]|nr:acyltransferase [Bacteroidia bacterium]
MTNNKVSYLEGVRGWASFMVFIHHFLLAFYPAHYYGDRTIAHTSFIEVWYFASPFSFLTNGNFMVAIFFVLSGFVLSKKYFEDNNFEYLISASIRRFFRLFIPSLAAIVLSYLIIIFAFNNNVEAAKYSNSPWLNKLYAGDYSFLGFLKEISYKTMFWGSNDFVNTLWSISTELLGSFLIFSVLIFTHNKRNRLMVLLLICAVIFSSFSRYYIAFILGILLNYIINDPFILKLKNNRLFILFLLVVGLFLGGFPSGGNIENTIYDHLMMRSLSKNYVLLHILGGFFLIIAVLYSNFLQKIFSLNLFVYLGRVSFSVYLIHPLIIGSFSCFLLVKVNENFYSYNLLILFIFIATTIIIFAVSHYFTKWVDDKSVVLSKDFYTKYFK